MFIWIVKEYIENDECLMFVIIVNFLLKYLLYI